MSTPLLPLLHDARQTALLINGMLVNASMSSASRSMPDGTSSGVNDAASAAAAASHTMLLCGFLLLMWVNVVTDAVERV